jgi:hypothetical protein
MKKIQILLAGLLVIAASQTQAADTPSMEEMWKIIQQQQQTIAELKSKLNSTTSKVVAQQETVEQQAQAIEVITESVEDSTGSSESKYSFGGYGELHYGTTDSGNSVDFHRFVMFNSYEFNEKTRFFSELEVEHSLSGDGKPGEVELEQAYIEHKFNESTQMKAGLMLMPVGILNETHEPDTFYGVERNNVEKNIIPSTWWEAGLGFSKKASENLGVDLFVSSGLNVPTSGSKAFLIRSGRQKVAKAKANDGAVTARLRYNPMNNLQIAASYQYQQDLTQGALGIDASLFEVNAQYNYNGFGLRALYAHWNLDDKAGLIAAGREEQKGYYIEPSYRFGENNQYGVFGRYSAWDNNAGDDNADTLIKQMDLGFNYWRTPRVVGKAEYQDQSGAGSDDGFHLGVGYSF